MFATHNINNLLESFLQMDQSSLQQERSLLSFLTKRRRRTYEADRIYNSESSSDSSSSYFEDSGEDCFDIDDEDSATELTGKRSRYHWHQDDASIRSNTASSGREEDFTAVSNRFNTATTNKLAPIVDAQLIETEGQYEIQIHLPGVDPHDIHVCWDQEGVFVSAEVQQDDDAVQMISTVRRCFQMPGNVDVEQVHVICEDQFLLVQLPKYESEEDGDEEEGEDILDDEEGYELKESDEENGEDEDSFGDSHDDDDSGSMMEVSSDCDLDDDCDFFS